MLLQEITNEVAPNKAATTGDQNLPHLRAPSWTNPFTASERAGHLASFGARVGCSIGQLIPILGSFQIIPASHSGAYSFVVLYRTSATLLKARNPWANPSG